MIPKQVVDIDLGLGSPNDIASEVAMDRFNFEQRKKGGLGYATPLEGLLEARKAVILWQQEKLNAGDLSPDNVAVGGGAAGGSRQFLTKAFEAFFEPGDQIALTNRYYNGHLDGIVTANLVPKIAPSFPNKDFLGWLTHECNHGRAPKGLVICNVPNPGGDIWSQSQLETLFGLCSQSGILAFEDYAYGPFDYEKCYATSLLSIDVQMKHTVFFGTASKMYGLAGYGVGFATAAQARMKQLLNAKRGLCEGGCKPAQYALASALNKDREYIGRARRVYKHRAWLTTQGVREIGLLADDPKGGMFGWFGVNGYPGGASRLVEEMKKRGVKLRDDSLYGGNNTNIRWCYRVVDEETDAALAILADVNRAG